MFLSNCQTGVNTAFKLSLYLLNIITENGLRGGPPAPTTGFSEIIRFFHRGNISGLFCFLNNSRGLETGSGQKKPNGQNPAGLAVANGEKAGPLLEINLVKFIVGRGRCPLLNPPPLIWLSPKSDKAGGAIPRTPAAQHHRCWTRCF